MKYIIILVIFISCNSQRNIIGVCADKFIIKDSIVYVDKYDTIFEMKPADTLIFWDNKYIFDTINIKSIKNIIKTKEKIVYRENVAKIESLNISYNDLNDKYKEQTIELIKMKERVKFYNTIRNIIIGITMLLLIIYISINTKLKKWF